MKKKAPATVADVLLCIFVILLISVVLEIVMAKTENLNFYNGAFHTMDCPDREGNSTVVFLHRASDIPGLSYELKPNISVMWQGANITTNSRGQRGRDYAVPKPEGTYRIVAVGDSVTFGATLDINDTFLHVLETKLNEHGSGRFEIINGGVSAYNLFQKYKLLEKRLMIYQPDMVLVNYVQDDFAPANILRHTTNCTEMDHFVVDKTILLSYNMPRMIPMPETVHRALLRHSALYRFLNINTYNIFSRLWPIEYPPEIYKIIGGKESVEYNKAAMDGFVALADRYDFTLVVVSFPNLVNDDTANDKWILSYPREKYNLTVLNLYTELREKGVDLEKIRVAPSDYAHPNANGSRIIGETLAQDLYPLIAR